MEDYYFEDYPVGRLAKLGEISVGESEMVDFARRYDPQPFHVDKVLASQSMYGGIIASGWFTCAITMKALVENYLSPSSSLGSPGIDELKWLAPVRPGDRLSISCEVVEARESRSRPDRGVIKTRIDVSSEVPVLTMVAVNLVLKRAQGD